MELLENGTEHNKGKGRDGGPLTHAKPSPAVPGDLGSGDQDANPAEKGRGDPDSGGRPS
jgi:hypothetical protein